MPILRRMPIVNVWYFSNNHLFVNVNVAAPQANRRHAHRNNIIAFLIPTILTLVQMRYPQQNLFQTNPTLTMISMWSVLAYCFAYSLLELLLLFTSRDTATYSTSTYDIATCLWRTAMMVFGSVSVASLLWLLLFHSPRSWEPVMYMILCLAFPVVVHLARKAVLPMRNLLSEQGRGRSTSLLPLTTMDLSFG
ncbi:hypothetical protein D8674_030828 [Pyrus ussuriensis x Pyrus communis]|uniref:Uncharacterized protein n=1 Tax=Pyrus ussuriensis x Pyrus communis TaxID=2448454 RepID=A0A5N5EWQ3_9ROSA|nr:hypothetical protein D8674_030828 [Pyrus ussuriensis x Pyrus communis]